MAPVIPNPRKIKAFRSATKFETWLAENHDRETELWLKIHKKTSGRATVTYAQALDMALCWGGSTASGSPSTRFPSCSGLHHARRRASGARPTKSTLQG